MVKNHAQSVFSSMVDVEDYPDDSIIIIDNPDGVCASSDEFLNDDFTILASYENQNIQEAQRTWHPYNVSPLLIAISEIVVSHSGIADDDNRIFFSRVEKSAESLYEYFSVSAAAQKHLHMRTAVKILYNGLSGYSEAKDDTYYETRFFSEWGEGEEGSGVLSGKPEPYKLPPTCMSILHKNHMYLIQATVSPNWRDVPYIKLIDEDGELPV